MNTRKSTMIESEIKDELNDLKKALKLKNDTDTIAFLMSIYKESRDIPKSSVELLIKLQA